MRIAVSAADSTSVRFFSTASTMRIPSSGNTGSRFANSRIQLHQKMRAKTSSAKGSCSPVRGKTMGLSSFGKCAGTPHRGRHDGTQREIGQAARPPA